MDLLKKVRENLDKVKKENPLVMNITNVVVTNVTANALLAIGASPVMAFENAEMEDMVSISQALVVNIGTLTKDVVESMFLAIDKANDVGIPVVFDPVGVGATRYRNEVAKKIVSDFKIDIIRGNASEIANLSGISVKTKGVDSNTNIENTVGIAKELSSKLTSVVCVSGAEDIITNSKKTYFVKNGTPMLTKITGSGCISTAIIGAFAAIDRDFMSACVTSALIVGISGEKALENSKGLGSFQVNFFDKLSLANEEYINFAKIDEVV